MILDIDMLCSCVVFGIVCENDRALVVAVDDIAVDCGIAEFGEESLDPDGFFCRLKERNVFRLGVGCRCEFVSLITKLQIAPPARVKSNPEIDFLSSPPP